MYAAIAVERVFSQVKHYVGGKCNALLKDYIQATLQLILNNHNDKWLSLTFGAVIARASGAVATRRNLSW